MRLAACSRLKTRQENRVWYRAIQSQHLPTALGTEHTVIVPSRYNPATEDEPAFQILYLAEHHQVALFEVGALLGSAHGHFVPNPHQAWTILNVQVSLQHVADLTDVAEQARLRTTAQELAGDWESYSRREPTHSVSQPTGSAPTQLLGAALFAVAGLEGFRTVSAAIPTQMNLVVFPSKLQTGSVIVFTDPGTGQSHSITPKPAQRRSGRRSRL